VAGIGNHVASVLHAFSVYARRKLETHLRVLKDNVRVAVPSFAEGAPAPVLGVKQLFACHNSYLRIPLIPAYSCIIAQVQK
jgi:hypothetical protein